MAWIAQWLLAPVMPAFADAGKRAQSTAAYAPLG
jgi:hypothetical protein